MSASSEDAIKSDPEISLELERLSLLSREQLAETLAQSAVELKGLKEELRGAELEIRYLRELFSNDLETLVPFIKNALKYQPELKLWASAWSPPTWMKYNKHYAGRNVRARHAAERPETRTTSPRGD